jgi:NAD(P)-dependent dehydrogenase (short-subunit alcohol dehydrogenase family)
MKLKGKTALVTGAADGIGLTISQCFASEGAWVVMGDVNAAKCAEEAAKISAQGGRAHGVACDVTQTPQVRALAAEAVKLTGRIDIVINNAAIAVSGNIVTMLEDDWCRVIDTNLTGPFRVLQAAIPTMLSQGAGSIVNIASMQGHRSINDWTAYASAKGGLLSMTVQLAGQLGPRNIRVNSISPGTINTPMNERIAAEQGKQMVRVWEKMHALERIGTPEEVAAAALFLASDDSSFVTGIDLKVDGGMATLIRIGQTE